MTVPHATRSDVVEIADELGEGEVAFVDADWIGAGATPTLVVGETSARWGDQKLEREPGSGREEFARRLLCAHAEALLALVQAELQRRGGGRVAAVGKGVTANLVRAELPVGAAEGGDRPPDVTIVLTGSPPDIVRATEGAADLGSIVLAGERETAELDINLYRHVHLRGLRVTGAPPLALAMPNRADRSVSTPTRAQLGEGGRLRPGIGSSRER